MLTLQTAIKAISTISSAQGLVSADLLLGLLEGAGLVEDHVGKASGNPGPGAHEPSPQEKDLQWLLVSKATTQAYGLILSILLDQTIPLSSDLYYWNQIIGSARYTGYYTLQTSPLRAWEWTLSIYHDTRARMGTSRQAENATSADEHADSVSQRWRQYYHLVRESIKERSLADVQTRLMTPFTRCQLEAKSKLKHVRRIREMCASGLGVLLDEGMMFDARDEESITSKSGQNDEAEEWKTVVSKSVTLMEAILCNIMTLEMKPSEFEETVFANVDEENGDSPNETTSGVSTPVALALRLQDILDKHLPAHIKASNALTQKYGRPSRLVRYWPLGLALLFSSGTLLRIFLRRQAEIKQWIQDFGETARDFWFNWVVEPVRKVIGTIRHDKDSEIAIMSKESLKGDRDSLERMVVDFATDRPNATTGKPFTEAEIDAVRTKVKEGDITPVLRAYEKDLRRPFIGTIRGDLIRALLVQIQKTKVDVEVAVGGIDNLLKSQELVFGFVGLTPGILVCIFVGNWLSGTLAGRRGRIQGQKSGSMIRPLRNIDRILSAATPANNGMLSYKEHGLLLCEVHLLRQRAQRIFPSEINNEFVEELNELIDLRTGIDRQVRVVERIRWAYTRWLR